jgi:transposase InsO family protein
MKATAPARLVRWALILSEFYFDIKYRQGKFNQCADALSRLACEENSVDAPDRIEEVISVIQRSLFGDLKISEQEVIFKQRNDPAWQAIIDDCLTSPNNRSDCFVLDEDILYKTDNMGRDLLVIPHTLIEHTLRLYHNSHLLVHPAQKKLIAMLQPRVYWNNMNKDILDWVAACTDCIKYKAVRPLSHGTLIPIISTRPFEILGVDILGPFQNSKKGYKYVLTCVDHFSSWVEAAPLRSITAEEVIKTFHSLIISRHGCPEKLLTDQGRQLIAGSIHELCELYNIQKLDTTAYHPQCNGKTEKFNQFLVRTLSIVLNKAHSNWDEELDNVLFTYRVGFNRTLKESPFYLIYGHDPLLPQDLFIPVKKTNGRNNTAQDTNASKFQRLRIMAEVYDKLQQDKMDERDTYKIRYDKTHHDVRFEIGDHVMLFTPRTEVGMSKKFLARWTGPFKIMARVNVVNYRLENHPNLVHVQRLRKYRPWRLRTIPKTIFRNENAK